MFSAGGWGLQVSIGRARFLLEDIRVHCFIVCNFLYSFSVFFYVLCFYANLPFSISLQDCYHLVRLSMRSSFILSYKSLFSLRLMLVSFGTRRLSHILFNLPSDGSVRLVVGSVSMQRHVNNLFTRGGRITLYYFYYYVAQNVVYPRTYT